MHHLFRRFIATPCFGPEDGAMSGGADPGAEGADAGTDAGDGGDRGDVADGYDGADEAGDGSDSGDASRDDESEDDLIAGPDEDEDTQTRSADERLKAVLKKFRKAKRQLLKSRTVNERLRGVGNVDDVVAAARQYHALQQRVQNSPKLRKLLLEELDGASGDDRGEAAPSARDDVSSFDPSKLPWDITTESGKYLAREALARRTMEVDLRRALKRIEQLEGGIQQRDQVQVTDKWRSGLNAAAKSIKDPDQRTILSDLVTAAFKLAPGSDPQKVIAHYMKLLRIAPQEQRIAANAARQRMAQRNTTLPRHQAGGGGSPTPARAKKETLADVHRRIRSLASAQ